MGGGTSHGRQSAGHTVTGARLAASPKAPNLPPLPQHPPPSLLFLHEGETSEEGKRRLGNDTQERATWRKEVLRKKLEGRKRGREVREKSECLEEHGEEVSDEAGKARGGENERGKKGIWKIVMMFVNK